MVESETHKQKDKKQRRKKAAKAQPKHAQIQSETVAESESSVFEVEYIASAQQLAPEFEAFAAVFSSFEARAVDKYRDASNDEVEEEEEGQEAEEEDRNDEKEGSEDELDTEAKRLASKKKKKLEQRLSIAQLKQSVSKPEVVEWVDVTAADPKLLVHLKSYRNTVPIPIHWQQKRKYLQGKRGIEKPPFELPDFIKQTGIMDMRQAVKEKEDAAKLKAKTRERVQPKMGRLDIDYQKLHDAFFRWQTKPKLTLHGDMYYEGKEFETKMKFKKPGNLSDELKEALGMTDPTIPSPWLINMQRYGPPPSYPGLKIPGLNCPIPNGAQWGFLQGGWGKPPVDELGRPLYGDVFGVMETVSQEHVARIERTLWGELEPEEEEEAAEDDEEEEEEEEAQEPEPAAPESGLVTPSGLASVPSGLETPDFIELRKDRRDDGPKELYKIIPQKDTTGKGFMGSQHTYDLSSTGSTFAAPPPAPSDSGAQKKRKAMPGIMTDKPVAMSLNPEDLQEGLEGDAVRRAYEDKMKAARMEAKGEDFSDLVAEHASRQQAKKRKKEGEGAGGASKGKKDEKFKF
ncbi:Splicing factor 3B subunit 2 [Chytriomyces hyalinus]|nr:Splicing factor 3B subunit 2 [Chytriomyces hyalinus]